MKKRYVLKNKVRFCTCIIMLIIMVVTVFSATRAYGYKEKPIKTITVVSGETLWSIAQRYNKSGDIREYIYQIKEINNLDTSDILAGCSLKVIIE